MEEDPPAETEPEAAEMESQSDFEATDAEAVKEAAANPWLLTITLFDTAALLPSGDCKSRDGGSTATPPGAFGAVMLPAPARLAVRTLAAVMLTRVSVNGKLPVAP